MCPVLLLQVLSVCLPFRKFSRGSFLILFSGTSSFQLVGNGSNTRDKSLLCGHCFSNPACLFPPSGLISGKLCSNSLGNAEMLRSLVVARNRKSPRQIATTGWGDSRSLPVCLASLTFLCWKITKHGCGCGWLGARSSRQLQLRFRVMMNRMMTGPGLYCWMFTSVSVCLSVSKPEESQGTVKTKYGDVME